MVTSNPWRKVSIFNSLGSVLKSSAMPALLINKCKWQGFEVNFFGTFQMMQAFLPLLKNSSNSKIINVTTVA
jgi:short-subunit dehydrogenase involved in D-alanine esterification of teichoic acids